MSKMKIPKDPDKHFWIHKRNVDLDARGCCEQIKIWVFLPNPQLYTIFLLNDYVHDDFFLRCYNITAILDIHKPPVIQSGQKTIIALITMRRLASISPDSSTAIILNPDVYYENYRPFMSSDYREYDVTHPTYIEKQPWNSE